MNILMVATGFLPYTFSENLCNGKLALALMAQGHKITVISRVDEGVTYSSSWEYPWLDLKDIVHEIHYSSRNALDRKLDLLKCGLKTRYIFEGTRWAARAIEEGKRLLGQEPFDCIISRSPCDVAHIAGYHLARYSRLPWIANWNDPADPIWPAPYNQNVSKFKKRLQRPYTAFLLEHADCNTFPSKELMEHFQKHFPCLKNKKCEVFPHIGLVAKYLPEETYIPAHKTMRLCHAGNLSGERNPELLFKAMQKFEQKYPGIISLDILGHQSAECQVLIQKYSLESAVHFPGSYSYIDALKKMAEYDILVLLEAKVPKGIFFASKIVDYLQLKKPVFAISPADGFAARFFDGSGTVVADNTSEESILQGLEQVYADYSTGNCSQKNGMSLLLKRISPETVVAGIEKLVKSLTKAC